MAEKTRRYWSYRKYTPEELKKALEGDASSKLPGESDKEHSRFLGFLDMGPGRSIPKYWKEQLQGTIQLSSLQTHSTRFQWYARAAAYDIQRMEDIERSARVTSIETGRNQLELNQRWAERLLERAIDEEDPIKAAAFLKAAAAFTQQVTKSSDTRAATESRLQADLAKIEAQIAQRNRDEGDDLD